MVTLKSLKTIARNLITATTFFPLSQLHNPLCRLPTHHGPLFLTCPPWKLSQSATPLYVITRLKEDYEARNYINQKVEVKSGTVTEEYLQKLDEALEVAGRRFNPELVIYNAGTDILEGDPLGRLEISPEGIALRDEKVFRFAREKNIPIVMLTSGGYMKSSARVIADSIVNLSKKCLIETSGAPKST